MNWKSATLALALAASLSGCLFRRKPAAPPPPPPLPAPVRPAPPAPINPPRVEPQPPSTPDAAPPAILPETTLPPAPKSPARPPRRRSRPAPASPAPAPPASPEPASPEPAAPRLGEFLSPAEAAELERRFQSSLADARQTLQQIASRPLSNSQAQSRARILSLLDQASSLKPSDPKSAATLASRAALLARDLLASLR